MWCGINRQRAERSRALGLVRPTSDATRAANAAQPTTRRRRPTHPRNTHEPAATSDATQHHHPPRAPTGDLTAAVTEPLHVSEEGGLTRSAVLVEPFRPEPEQ